VTPWFPGTRGMDNNNNNCNRHLSAYANYMFFRSLIRSGIYITGINNYVLMIKHLINAFIHW
ncbi:MAG: hypothetical protein ACP5NQ_09295, partial [Vulcanisaeta sp.]